MFLAYAWQIQDCVRSETEAQNTLRQTGFTEQETYLLERLRQRYAARIDGQDDLATYRRLQFVRWLVTTVKLTEQVA